MKKIHIILFNLLLALTITACSKEPLDGPGNQGLNFDVVLDNNLSTKAASYDLFTEDGRVSSFSLEIMPETKSVQINHPTTFTEIYDSFKVEGREHNTQVFYDKAVYNATTGLWSLQNSQYLIKPGKQLEIVAAASAMSDASTDAFFSEISYDGDPSTASFNYSLPDDLASQKDFLIGYYKGAPTAGTVSLKFNHPLTSLVFVTGPLPLGLTLQVNSITLEGIDSNAQCTVTFGENTVYSWDSYSEPKSYTRLIDNPHPMEEGDDILDETQSFIVIPRSFPNDSEAKIVFNITENDGTSTRAYDMFFPLAGQTWNPGETNIYQISYHGEHKALLLDGPSFNEQLAILSGRATNETYSIGSTTFNYTKIPGISTIIFQPQSSNTTGTLVNVPGERPIYMKKSGTTVTITTDDFEFYLGSSASIMFQGLVDLTSIQGLEYVNTKDVVDFQYIFAVCKKLTSIDLSHFNTENGERLAGMFAGCELITSIDLSSFKTDKVKNISALFGNMQHLTTINWGDNFQLKTCTSISHVFSNCKALTNLDLSFILGSTSSIDVAFLVFGCDHLQSLNIKNLRGHYTRTWYTFSGCHVLSSINLGSFQTLENVYVKTHMFQNCSDQLNGRKCTITCTQAAWDEMTTGDSNFVASRFTPNIVS